MSASGQAADDPNAQQRKNAMVGRANEGSDVNPPRLPAPVSPWTLQAGSVIAASLLTGLNSELPGLVTAQITDNVYDSVTARSLLIPHGSRLVGTSDIFLALGPSRAPVFWHRPILHSCSSLAPTRPPC